MNDSTWVINGMIMRNIIKIIFTFSLLMPLSLSADISSGVFRFQVKLAEQGNPEAQYKVGEMYETGKGVQKNVATALTWFEKAAAQDHEKAGYKLLYLDIKTNGLNNNSKTQLGILRQESASGNPDAQYYLGKMYATGVGVPKSLNNALTWLNKATFNGVSEAEHEAITVEEQLARNREKSANKRALALEASKSKKAEEEAAKKKKQQQAERNRKAEAEKRQSKKNSEARKIANEKKKIAAERAELARQKAQLNKERAAAQAAQEEPEPQVESRPEPKSGSSSFDSDPCKGKKAKFLSTCR